MTQAKIRASRWTGDSKEIVQEKIRDTKKIEKKDRQKSLNKRSNKKKHVRLPNKMQVTATSRKKASLVPAP